MVITMSSNLRNAKDIFVELVGTAPPEQWDERLAEACQGDEGLRRRVRALLRAHAEPGSFLQQPAIGGGPTPSQGKPIAEFVGAVIGPYKLLQQIGEGGMGVVFMAEQTEPIQRMVALKIIKPGMDTRQVIGRFEAERQALAAMDHPNIARVLDAGTTESGHPYFVMELVKGVPITKYCDEQQLSLQDRLALLLPVCHAVQHAHQKGIIHRDIKPTNVLVAEYDNHAVPKVIDFGVAKATALKLTQRTMFTEFGQVIGTVEYMSPEQAKFNQLDVDTRSDIYSLGVLLYELLTGSPPFEQKRLREAAFDEVLRIIREEDPPKPSKRLSTSETLPSIAAQRHTEPAKLSREVRGELDWIVMKALDKDRDRRYETAAALAADIEHYRADEPVSAGPPSRAYRFVKFVRRNRGAAAASAVILLALIAGVIGLSIGLVSQSRQRAAAERERAEAQLNLAAALQSLGEYDEAEALYRQELTRPLDAAPQARQRRARTRLHLAQVLREQQGASAALSMLRAALAEYRDAFSANDSNIVFALNELAFLLRDGLGEYAEAEVLFRESLAIRGRALPVDHIELGVQLFYVGNVLAWQQKFVDAERYYGRAIQEYELGYPPGDASTALARMEYAVVLIALNRFAEAEAELLQSESALRLTPPQYGFAATSLTCLYARWDEAQPGKGYDLKSREWAFKIYDAFFKSNDRSAASKDAEVDASGKAPNEPP